MSNPRTKFQELVPILQIRKTNSLQNTFKTSNRTHKLSIQPSENFRTSENSPANIHKRIYPDYLLSPTFSKYNPFVKIDSKSDAKNFESNQKNRLELNNFNLVKDSARKIQRIELPKLPIKSSHTKHFSENLDFGRNTLENLPSDRISRKYIGEQFRKISKKALLTKQIIDTLMQLKDQHKLENGFSNINTMKKPIGEEVPQKKMKRKFKLKIPKEAWTLETQRYQRDNIVINMRHAFEMPLIF